MPAYIRLFLCLGADFFTGIGGGEVGMSAKRTRAEEEDYLDFSSGTMGSLMGEIAGTWCYYTLWRTYLPLSISRISCPDSNWN